MSKQAIMFLTSIQGNTYEVVADIDIAPFAGQREPISSLVLSGKVKSFMVSDPHMLGYDENDSIILTPFHRFSEEKVVFRSKDIYSMGTPNEYMRKCFQERVENIRLLERGSEHVKDVLRRIAKTNGGELEIINTGDGDETRH